MIDVGKKIKLLLTEKGITYTALGEIIGKKKQTISTILRKESMTTDTLQLFMKGAGLNSHQIFEDYDDTDYRLLKQEVDLLRMKTTHQEEQMKKYEKELSDKESRLIEQERTIIGLKDSIVSISSSLERLTATLEKQELKK